MTTKPILVMMSYRGGVRLQRCLESIARSRHHFSRVILSIASSTDSEDMRQAEMFRKAHPDVEVICTGVELPTMQHQEFWVTYLENTEVELDSWIYWLAYDDEVRETGIRDIIDNDGNWPLRHGSAYFGPWAMRHESAELIWDGDRSSDLESWTSFAPEGPLKLPVMRWIDDQLRQPTYIQMSGSVCSFESFLRVRDGHPRKRGPMRIEMAVAAAPCNSRVEEFLTPVSIIYGRPNSDRASYGAAARSEDRHLLAWIFAYALRHPRSLAALFRLGWYQLLRIAQRTPAPAEEWRVRGTVGP